MKVKDISLSLVLTRAPCQIMICFQQINWQHRWLLLKQRRWLDVQWLILSHDFGQPMWFLRVFVYERLFLLVLGLFFTLSSFLSFAWFICIVGRRDVDDLLNHQAVIFELLVIPLQTKSESLENIVQLFRVDSRSHTVALSPFREEIFKARTNFLAKGDEHIVGR